MYSEACSQKVIIDNDIRIRNVCMSIFHYTAQHCFAADAAGAAFGLGAIFFGRGVPPAVLVQTPASGAAESWRWAASQGSYCLCGIINHSQRGQGTKHSGEFQHDD